MRIFDRIISVVLALLLLAVCLFVGAASLGWPLRPGEWVALAQAYNHPVTALIAGLVALVVAALCLRLIFARKTKRKPVQPASALIKTTDIGNTYIALSALEAMAQRHIRASSRVRDCLTAIRVGEDGSSISFSVKLTVLPETPLPDLTAQLQKSLKEYVEEQSGILVGEVGVLVESASAIPAARVE